jgi:2'-5' RNA ligase
MRKHHEMKLAVVAYPHLAEGDRQRIESFRAEHDPQVSRITLHFTLVFPFEGVPDELVQEMAVVARSTEPIAFAIRRSAVAPDGVGNGYHIFLVPDEGRGQIAALHDRLCAGALRPYLRGDIPFVPHITVGAARDAQVAEGWAEALDVPSRIVQGTVAGIDLVDVGHHRVQSVASYVLGSAARTRG